MPGMVEWQLEVFLSHWIEDYLIYIISITCRNSGKNVTKLVVWGIEDQEDESFGSSGDAFPGLSTIHDQLPPHLYKSWLNRALRFYNNSPDTTTQRLSLRFCALRLCACLSSSFGEFSSTGSSDGSTTSISCSMCSSVECSSTVI